MTGKLYRAAELQLILKYESEGCAHKKRRRNEKHHFENGHRTPLASLVPHRATDENRG